MTASVRPLLHLAERVFNRAHLIDPGKARVILGVLAPRLGAVAPSASSVITAEAPGVREDLPAGTPSIAVIDVHGTLVSRASGDAVSGGPTSYREISHAFRAARDDPSVRAILFDIDSPGGECDGAFDLADEIFAARGSKPIWAVADHSCYSAAYAIAAACERIVVSRTGGVGSIGVFYLHADISEWDSKQGIAWTPIFAGARKLDGWEHRPLSKEAREAAQADVDAIYGLFTGSVARWRGLEEAAVRGTEAGCFSGLSGDAVATGLADEVGTFDDALAALSAEVTTRERSSSMATSHRRAIASGQSSAGKPGPARGSKRKAEGEDTVVGETDDDTESAEGDDTVESAEGDDDTISGEGEDTVVGEGEDDDEDKAPATRATAAERRRCSAILDAAALAGASFATVAKAVREGQSAASFLRRESAAKAASQAGRTPIRPHHGARGSGSADNHGWGKAVARAAGTRPAKTS